MQRNTEEDKPVQVFINPFICSIPWIYQRSVANILKSLIAQKLSNEQIRRCHFDNQQLLIEVYRSGLLLISGWMHLLQPMQKIQEWSLDQHRQPEIFLGFLLSFLDRLNPPRISYSFQSRRGISRQQSWTQKPEYQLLWSYLELQPQIQGIRQRDQRIWLWWHRTASCLDPKTGWYIDQRTILVGNWRLHPGLRTVLAQEQIDY